MYETENNKKKKYYLFLLPPIVYETKGTLHVCIGKGGVSAGDGAVPGQS